jgi:erythromycin esterase-like protein
MAETLDVLIEHLRQRQKPKVIVWAHNSHLGDARATEMGEQGELNMGQLVRERHAADAILIGFTTYSGTVTAASGWDRPAERKLVRPALAGSVEALLHAAGLPRFMLNLRGDDECSDIFSESRLERAIGVVYLPETERQSHYFEARLAEQFDAVIHFDESRAVEPLERTSRWHSGEAAETFPTGM